MPACPPTRLGGQPGREIAERRQVRRDGFVIMAIKGGNEGAERFGVVLPQGKDRHSWSNFDTRRFYDGELSAESKMRPIPFVL